MLNNEQIIEIIRKHKAECEQAAAIYYDMESSPKLRYLPLQTVLRKQYAISAQIDLLRNILDEIVVEEVE